LDRPVFFCPNRVWRCYTGGALMDKFVGKARGKDGQFPEDWLASTTVAENGPHQQSPAEGLSRVRLANGSAGPLLKDLIEASPEECLGPGADPAEGVGVLCKLLDSAVRLPIQCHPDRAFARKHYRSAHGKAESWFVLGVRKIKGEDPYLLMGFKPGVNARDFRKAVAAQDIAAMTGMLHRHKVKPGDCYFIPGRFPHAIGPGVFLLEVQEPTDWVVQPERRIGKTKLTDTDMWGPLSPEIGLKCFDYSAAGTAAAARRAVALRARPLRRDKGSVLEEVVGPAVTDCFRVERLTVRGAMTYEPGAPYHIAVIAEGRGEVRTGGRDAVAVRQGDTMFVPNGVRSLHYATKGGKLVLYAIH
jgi:mannose-6-phosphate isomerase